MGRIAQIAAEQVSDSRGKPTVKTSLVLSSGVKVFASVASGTSTGKNEAFEKRDEDGSVSTAVRNINETLAPALKGEKVEDQKRIDQLMIDIDGSVNKENLGANAILSVSIAAMYASAKEQKKELFKIISQQLGQKVDYFLPDPVFNVLEGGLHAKGGLEFQEFLVIPRGKEKIAEKGRLTLELVDELKNLLQTSNISFYQGMEGGIDPVLTSNLKALELLNNLISSDMSLGLDVASGSFFKQSNYLVSELGGSDNKKYIQFLIRLSKEYRLAYLEDPFAEEDWDSWKTFSKVSNSKIMTVGDDLTATNSERLEKALSLAVLGGVIVKPNQIGTVTETLNFIRLAKKHQLKVIVSHRSGETEDTFISDLAVGVGADFIKLGLPLQKERRAKFDRLVEIESLTL